MLPFGLMAWSPSSAERRPVSVVQKDLETRLLGEFAGLDVEDDDAGFCVSEAKAKRSQELSITEKRKGEGERQNAR